MIALVRYLAIGSITSAALVSGTHASALAEDKRLSSWVMVPGLTLSQIYFDAAISLDKPKNRPNYEVTVVGASALPAASDPQRHSG